MYKCTECNAQYTQCPDFCDCGNDTFEEVYEEVYEEEYEYVEEPVKPKRRKKPEISPEELEEIEEEKRERIKSFIVLGISLVVSIVVVVMCPPHFEKKVEQVKKQAIAANIKVPDVNSYWDNTLTYTARKKDSYYKLPLLNDEFNAISSELFDYIKKVGAQFDRRWDPSLVKGTGECRVTFTIDKEGNLDQKYTRITDRSHNESLDDSVLMLLSRLNGFDVPPPDYKGERIIIAFKKDERGVSKVYFPTK